MKILTGQRIYFYLHAANNSYRNPVYYRVISSRILSPRCRVAYVKNDDVENISIKTQFLEISLIVGYLKKKTFVFT